MRGNVLITPEVIRAQSGEAAQLLTKLNKLDRNSKQARKIRRQLRKLGVSLATYPITAHAEELRERRREPKSWKEKVMEQVERKRRYKGKGGVGYDERDLLMKKSLITFPSGAVSLRKLTKREKKLRRDKRLGLGKYGLERKDVEKEKLREERAGIFKSKRRGRRRREKDGERIDQVLDTAQQLVLAGYNSDEKIASRLLELYPKIDGERAIVAARAALFKKNPRGKFKRNLPDETIEVYDKVLAIEAKKGSKSNYPNEYFRHDFKGATEARILGLPDGSLLIKSKKGKRLWNNFEA
jgi:predicted nuclease with RNAse H fold